VSPLFSALACLADPAVKRVYLLISPSGEILTWTISLPHARRMKRTAHPDDPKSCAYIMALAPTR
jgi:hypothetical protein